MDPEDPSRNRYMPARRGIVVAKGGDRRQAMYRELNHPIFSDAPYRLAVVLSERGSISAQRKTLHAFNGHIKAAYKKNAKIHGDLGIYFMDSPSNNRPAQIYWFSPDLGDEPDETLKSLHRIWFDNKRGASIYPYIPYPSKFEQIFCRWDLQQWDMWLRWLLSWMVFKGQAPRIVKETYLTAHRPAKSKGGLFHSPEPLQACYTFVPYLPEAWILKNHPPYVKECKFCKRPIINIDPRRDYCNESCKNKAYRDRKEKNGTIVRHGSCIHCGGSLQEKRSGAKFCSDNCRQAHHRAHQRGG